MAETFDVQRDHVDLIHSVMRLLAPGGTLIFSKNLRKFKIDSKALADLKVTDISAKTLPRDYARNPQIHNCWQISRGEEA